MKNITITLLLIIILSIINYSQNRYNVQPGVKNNQIVLELKNISPTEQATDIKVKLIKKSEHIKFITEEEILESLAEAEQREVKFRFDIEYNVGSTKADTIEFLITDEKTIQLTKQFILEYSTPTEYKLEQNYPNPFNPSTMIRWQSPIGSRQTIKLYNTLGEEVDTIVDEYLEAGYHSKLYTINSSLPSGVYFYRLQAGSYTSTKKMVLLR